MWQCVWMNLLTHSEGKTLMLLCDKQDTGKKLKAQNIYLQCCFLVQGWVCAPCICVCVWLLCVCLCQRGNSNQGDIRCGWGSSLTTLKRGHHQRSCMTLGPSCISLWGLIILAGALLSPSLRAFSWAYQKHNTKICREEEVREEEGGGGLSQSEEDSDKLWHQKKRRSFVQRDSISEEE